MSHPINGFHAENRFLSNFVSSKVVLDGETYPTVEHAFAAAKTLNLIAREEIRNALTPGSAKRKGRKVILRDGWETIKIDVMRDLLIQKFSQEPFKRLLLATGDSYLEETNNWNDTFWGVCNGVGKNNLGILLMEIRGYLVEITNL